MKRILIITLGLQLIFFSVSAQEITKDTIQWKSSSFINLKNKEKVLFESTLISYGSDKIEWIQNNGNDIYEFKILETSNTWSDLTANGKITFNVKYDNSEGEVIIESDGKMISIILDMRKSNPEGGAFKFTISTYSVIFH